MIHLYPPTSLFRQVARMTAQGDTFSSSERDVLARHFTP